jgi:hypothetical protein
MFWDESYESWLELGIRSQPAAILFAADGARLGAWSAIFDEDEVLELIDA